MLKNPRPGITPEEEGKRGPVKFIEELRAKGNLVAYVGDVVGTGSSRKSATNSVLWFTGEDIPFVPNKRFGGVCLGAKIAPIFYNTMEDAGALPIELDVSQMDMGDVIELRPYEGKALKNGEVIAEFKVKSDVLFDEVRAGGRIPLIVGRGLTAKAREALGLPPVDAVPPAAGPADTRKGFTLAQKMVGRACGLPEGQGVRPGTYCEPKMTSVGSQDTTGPMTRDELKDLACLGFSRRPGDAVVLPHGGLSEAGGREDAPRAARVHHHPRRRFAAPGRRRHPLAGSTACCCPTPSAPAATATRASRSASASRPAPAWWPSRAATGVMPLDMPESVLVRFKGKMQPGVTLRDLVNAIPLYAIKAGPADGGQEGQEEHLLRPHPRDRGPARPEGRTGVRAVRRLGRALRRRLHRAPEQGADHRVHQQQHHADALDDRQRLLGRAHAGAPHRGAWKPGWRIRSCSRRDADAEYAAVIEIDLADIHEPIVACPNDPDDVKTLSDVAGEKIDEVFIGSCMTNIGHFRAASKLLEGKRDIPVKLWVAPPTKMDARQLTEEGHYGVLGTRRRAHGNAGLLAVHGQPGAGAGRRDGVLDLDAQLPQPPGQEQQRLPGQRRAGLDLLQAGAHPDHARSTWSTWACSPPRATRSTST